MAEPNQERRYRFGVFEADAGTGELRRQGVRLRLNAQPFQVLLMLLDRRGALVTREEISRELWPEGTFVDYDHGVNSAVNRIREALGDTAGSPRFIETLARRGYRFIAPVERIEGSEIVVAAGSPQAAKDANKAEEIPDEAGPVDEAGSVAEVGQNGKSGFGILASEEDLPKSPYAVVQTLYILFQLMYLGFYVGALSNLTEIQDLLSPLPRSAVVFGAVIVTAAILIPVRAFLLCAVIFHPPGVRQKLLKVWPFVVVFDELWALSPFLLLHHINFGLALACTTLLVYSPFAQRSLVLMGAGSAVRPASAQGKQV
ncbi:MAG: winged helix-turn-helix domain-containing protein [Terracidiphilus sp.]